MDKKTIREKKVEAKATNTVLLKLHRQYSKDEAVAWSLNKIKSLLVEKGQNEAYILELEEKLIAQERELQKRVIPEDLAAINRYHSIAGLKKELRAMKEERDLYMSKTNTQS
jgi:hypothetical protein